MDEIRAEPELGGLGPGLTGEYSIYSFVVCRNDKRYTTRTKPKTETRNPSGRG